MSVVEARIRLAAVGDILIGTPSQEDLDNGADPTVEAVLPAMVLLPIANPQTGNPIAVPFGEVRLEMTKEEAAAIGAQLVEKADNLPDPKPKVETASNLSEVEQAAERLKRLQGTPPV